MCTCFYIKETLKTLKRIIKILDFFIRLFFFRSMIHLNVFLGNGGRDAGGSNDFCS